ncbi:acyltransferase family protein [Rhizobium deserti]|nr:acyltransferase family protein [Rhizobium deserti]
MDFTDNGCYPSAIAEVMMKYRREIDGLRAVAVVPVILYHANLGLVPGGFVGVDIFFVISGFLITTIILEDLSRDRFSILHFYERRLRRIAPALLLVCLACVPFAALWMLPSEFKAFGKSLFHSVLMVANFERWGHYYFSPSNELKPLLHMWSLAVEEQFYLVFPPLLWLLRRTSRRWMLAIVGGLAAVSFILTWPLSKLDPSANFYLPFTRLWELALGAMLAIQPLEARARLGQRSRSALAMLGLLAILASYVVLVSGPHHPGPITLIPCLGTLLIIAFASPQNLAGRLLGLPPIVAIGLISYSLYLWHQPVFAFARLRMIDPLAPSHYLVLMTLILTLATFSYFFVEKPFRRGQLFPAQRIFAFAGAGGAALIVIGIVMTKAGGFASRGHDLTALRTVSSGISDRCNGRIEPACVTKPEPTMAVWGDSFAMHVVDGILASQEAGAPGLVQLNKSTCAPLLNLAPALPDEPADWARECLTHNAEVRGFIQSTPSLRYVVVSSKFSTYLDAGLLIGGDGTVGEAAYQDVRRDFEATLDWLRLIGLKPVVFAPPPRDGRDAGLCVSRSVTLGIPDDFCAMRRQDEEVFDAKVKRLMEDVSTRFPVVSVDGYLCDQQRCRVGEDGVSFFYDDGHFSRQGSKYLGQRLDFYHHLVDAAEHGCVAGGGEPRGICQMMPAAVPGVGAAARSNLSSPTDGELVLQ